MHIEKGKIGVALCKDLAGAEEPEDSRQQCGCGVSSGFREGCRKFQQRGGKVVNEGSSQGPGGALGSFWGENGLNNVKSVYIGINW